MTLTNRLTLGSLAALAVVLAGFSLTIYWTARNHLYRRAEERLVVAARVLVASCEIKPDGVEWEVEERKLGFGPDAGRGRIDWLVTDGEGRTVDQSDTDSWLVEYANPFNSVNQPLKQVRRDSGQWLVFQETIAGTPGVPFSPPVGKQRKFPSLIMTVGLSLEPLRSTLDRLAFALVAISVGIWLLAAIAARMLCRWALRPVIRMVDAASDITAADLSARLPTPNSRDELAALGAAFNELLGRVEQAYLRQRSFTAEASHQLRTPITALLGQVEVALRRERDTTEYQRVLESVQRQGDRLRRVVESLLFLARSETDAALPQREAVDLDAWVVEHIRERWAAHERFGDIRIDANPTRADVHPVLLGELVDVLIDNALKYSPAATPVVIRVRPHEGAELVVEDLGPGLSETDQTMVFEPFVRADSARLGGVEGSGLGLSVARRIAAAHGGTLSVSSTAGSGSRFTLLLPDPQH